MRKSMSTMSEAQRPLLYKIFKRLRTFSIDLHSIRRYHSSHNKSKMASNTSLLSFISIIFPVSAIVFLPLFVLPLIFILRPILPRFHFANCFSIQNTYTCSWWTGGNWGSFCAIFSFWPRWLPTRVWSTVINVASALAQSVSQAICSDFFCNSSQQWYCSIACAIVTANSPPTKRIRQLPNRTALRCEYSYHYVPEIW